MTEFAHPATDYTVVEREPPQVMERNLRIAARLWASSTAFFFFAFLFAYFYLRTLNEHHLWHPHGVTPSFVLGTVVTGLIVIAAGATWAGARTVAGGDESGWRLRGGVALVLGVAAVAVQIAQWSTLGFGPTDGGYASVFVGWTGFLALFVLGTLYWHETLLATSLRYRRAQPAAGEASGDPDRPGHDIARPASLVAVGTEALAFYWIVLAVIAVATWLVLYVLG